MATIERSAADERGATGAPAGSAPHPARATVDGNQLLPDGPGRLQALLDLIDRAERELRLLYYIYAPDRAGTLVRDRLAGAARRGVRVSLVVDGFGSSADEAFFSPLVEAGGSICRFSPRWGRRYLLRNHQKLALADGHRVIVGGFNIEDSYFAGDGEDGWRDLGLLVEGPAAGRLRGYFDALRGWIEQGGARLRDLRRVLRTHSEGAGAVRWLLGGPTRRLSPWGQVLKRDMGAAARVDILAGYFTPSPAMLRGMERVARHGTTRVVTAARSDNDATIAAARHSYARLLRRGVRVFEYQPRRLHSKLFVVDDIVHLGSANFDVRSLFLNLEIMIRIEDAGFADAMRGFFAAELEEAAEVTAAMHARAGWWDRLRWAAAYFLVAVVDGNITRRLNSGIDGR
jgi:cardiolipin synthase A/B